MLKKYFTKKFKEKIIHYMMNNYKKIDVEPGAINYYLKCHLVSTHYAIKNGDKELALVLSLNKNNNWPVVHFINYNGNNFIDNSYGHLNLIYDYYLIKMITKDQFFNTSNILIRYQKKFSNMSNFLEKIFADTNI